MPKIALAEHAGVGADGRPRPTEDHVVVLDNAALLLDGATSPSPDLPPGGWYAGLLADRLSAELRADPEAELTGLLARSIADVAEAEGLRPGRAPSSTVAVLRWTAERIDALVLADSPIVAFGQTGYEVVADDRLIRLRRAGKLMSGAAVRALRNTPAGFWVAEADPAAASYAVCRSWPAGALRTVLLASDGVAVGVDEYGLFDWPEALALARRHGPAAVLDAVRAAEDEDPHGEKWPRPKRHDDQALIVADFA
ncbi:hypothetical protein ORV05_31130 [Amycolatopsis cynarae]|uniref:Protein phosphatase 2C domain-containing protein n=1 Tax=Amycolatopsis cynarae TaxID=2995223 RepID=A0ABY7AZ56_9PSEU|nr:hypothetical protein [Amycolatopsis sp. HUAS 11-8]WAL65310.1 hypothetical protein ORV05_31130 [Amycolatopsis sp. HUAS 11-8]